MSLYLFLPLLLSSMSCRSHLGGELDLGVFDIVELVGVLVAGDIGQPGVNAGGEICALGEHEEIFEHGRCVMLDVELVIAGVVVTL